MSAGEVIKCQAMVLREKGKQQLETVYVAPPKKGEVRLQVIYSSCCHTDALVISGDDPETPIDAENGVILGHEAVAIVESIGPDVTRVKVGDKVIPAYIPNCKNCRFCNNPKTNLCSVIRTTQGAGQMPDGTSRFTDEQGRPIRHFMGISAFSQYTVCAEISVIPISEEAFELGKKTLPVVGCGWTTGYNSAIAAEVTQGSTATVIGLGGVGLACVQALKAAGASKIFGVDINPAKKELAEKLGVTHFINPKELPEGQTLQSIILSETEGWGCDYSFECVGNVDLMSTALQIVCKGTGRAYIIGVATGASISFRSFLVVSGRSISGFAFGNADHKRVQELVDQITKREIIIDDFITNERPLSEVNEAFHDMHAGKGIRTIIKMD